MNPIDFPQCTATYATHQPEYLNLPAHRVDGMTGEVITCWKAPKFWSKKGFVERLRFFLFGRMWLRQLTFNAKLQPVQMMTESPYGQGLSPEEQDKQLVEQMLKEGTNTERKSKPSPDDEGGTGEGA